MPIVGTGQFTITDLNDGVLAFLSNESAVVPSNPDGSSPNLSGCVTTLMVNLGGVDDSANWSVTASASSGVTGTLSSRTYTVTGFTVDVGWVDLTATRVGWPSLTKRFNLSKSKQGVTGATGAAGSNGLNFSEAKLLFSDPTFQVGSNGVSVYNNSANGMVTHARIAKLADSPFADSGFNIEISNTGAASPGIGGFFHGLQTRANAVFIQRFVAKVPVGYTLATATNAMGTGSNVRWLTSNAGTGQFQEYLVEWRCGHSGTFSSTVFIYLAGTAGTPAVPVKWWLAYETVYDFTALGFSTVVGLLSNDSHTVPTDSEGNSGNFTGASTTLTIYNGTADDSANWAVTAAPTNVTGSLAGKTYTVTAMSADTGYVDLTATRSGFASVVKRFTLSKSKGGVTGATGPQGPSVVVTSNRAATFTATDGTLDGSQADIVLTASVSGVTSPTYSWTFSGLQTNPAASTTSTQSITAAQFGTSKSAIVTCTVSGTYTDTVTIVRLEKSTAAAGANQTYVDANGNIQGVSSGSGTQVDNSVAIGDMMNSGGGLLPNWNLNLSDASGKPAGIYGVEGIADRSGIQFGDASRTWVKLSHPTDTTIAYGFPAIPIDDRKAYVFRVRHKTNSASPPASGLYYYFIEKAGALDVGKTHVIRGGGDTTIGSLETSVKYVYFNSAYPSNSGWTETTDLVYVPTAGTRFASFSIASWNFATSVELHIDAVYLTSLSSTVYRQTTQPTGGIYVKGDVWINTGSTDTPMRHFDGTAWQLVSNYVTNTNQLTDGAGLGGTATWSGVSGAGKPLDNAGQVLDTRNDNLPPNSYVKGNHREFKLCSVVGITTSATYCVVETIKGWGDSSGGEATQWAYVSSGEVWKRSAPAGATAWNAWVRDLDLSLYTGALNATNNVVGNGTLAARPTGTDGDFYYATDTGAMYQKIAGAWVLSSNNTSIDASGNIQGVSGGAGQSVANNVDNVIRAPGGALSVNNASSVTGALKIKLPQLWTNTMMRFTVEIYEYLAGFTCTLEVAGYNHTGSGGYWVNCTARVIGGSNVEYPVRFGRDADKCCVWIGNSTETWSYPQVRVRDFLGGHTNATAAQWSTGWAISFDTTTLTAAGSNLTANQFNVHITDTLPGADWAKTSGANKPADNATRNVHRGIWASGTSYVLGDTVIHQGYGWSCILATSSVAPPTYPTTSNANWTLAAVKGEDAKSVYLTATSQVLKVDRANVITPSSITLTATGQNCAGSPVFTVTSGTATLTGSGNTRELDASQMTTDQVTVEVVWDGRSDLITLSKIREGAEALTVLLSNESHVVQADQDGSVASFAGSGTDVVVYQGSSPLVAVLGGSPGTFAVGTPTVAPAGAYVPGTVTHLGDKAVLADATAMAADTAVVMIPVTVTRTDGTVVTFSLRQSVVKARRGLTGPTFRLLASAPGFRFVDGLANPPDQALVISALRYGSEAEVVYELVDGGGEVVLSGAGMLSGLGAAMGMPFTQSSDDAYLSADVLAGRQSVTVRATCGDLSDSVTLVRLNDSTAQAGATVGAPPGTNVGSTPAETVESNANNASSAVFDPATGLAQRMRANADNVLGGVLVADATAVPVGLRVGSVTWDAAGAVTGGSGVAITPKGVYARNPSKTTFVLDATTGDATFSGNLTGANITGATGTFSGSLTAETLGSLAQAPITITTSQSVTVPAGMNSARYELVGGGAGGGGGGATGFVEGYGGGGGSGAYISGTISVTPEASLAITIGAGGAGGANTLAGGNGGSSSIGALVTAAGGIGGGGSAAGGGFGAGGATPTSVPTAASKAGATAARVYDGAETTHNGYGKFDGEAKYDGAGFPKPGVTGAGGANPLGTGGASVNTGVGSAGTGYGSGGSGGGGSLSTNVSAVGGAGRPGMCRLTFLNSNGVVLQSQFENLKQVLAAQGIAVA